jgi:hypothetical protein
MAKYIGDDHQENDPRTIAVNTYADAMLKVKDSLKVLQNEGMACVACDIEHTCEFAYDLYNFGQQAKVDCLAAK